MTMTLVSILAGAFLANLLGVFWYMILAKPWQAAARVSQDDIENTPGLLMFLYPLVAWIIANIGLALLIHLTGLVGMQVGIQLVIAAWIAGDVPRPSIRWPIA